MSDIFGPQGITIGSFTIYYYGLLIVAGILIGTTIAAWMAKRDGKDPDHIWGGLTWALIPAIVGSRLWFVLFPPESVVEQGFDTGYMLSHPFDLNHGPFAIRSGGLGIWGAIIGALVGIYLYYRRHREEPLLEWLDIPAVVVPLGQAIGRWGNFANRELYGPPTDLPWGIDIPQGNRVSPYKYNEGYGPDTRFHPIFLYESIWNFATFAFLLFVWHRYRDKLRAGDILIMYFVIYPLGRFLLEFMRVDTAYVMGININQAIMGVTAVVAAALLLYRHRPGLATAEVPSGDDAGDEVVGEEVAGETE